MELGRSRSRIKDQRELAGATNKRRLTSTANKHDKVKQNEQHLTASKGK